MKRKEADLLNNEKLIDYVEPIVRKVRGKAPEIKSQVIM